MHASEVEYQPLSGHRPGCPRAFQGRILVPLILLLLSLVCLSTLQADEGGHFTSFSRLSSLALKWDDRSEQSLPGAPAISSAFVQLFNNITTNGSRSGQEADATGSIRPSLCVIARTFGSQASYLPLFLLSIANLGIDSSVYLVNTDESMTTTDLAQASDLVNALIGRPGWSRFLTFLDSHVRKETAVEAEAETEDYGYGLTDKVLAYLYDGNFEGQDSSDISGPDCSHALFSNADNFYVRGFAEHLSRPLNDKAIDLIGFNWLSKYRWHEPIQHKTALSTKGHVDGRMLVENDDGTHVPKQVAFEPGYIDLGAAIFRMSFLKANKMFFADDRALAEPDEFTLYDEYSDGRFVKKAFMLARKSWIERAHLFVHQ